MFFTTTWIVFTIQNENFILWWKCACMISKTLNYFSPSSSSMMYWIKLSIYVYIKLDSHTFSMEPIHENKDIQLNKPFPTQTRFLYMCWLKMYHFGCIHHRKWSFILWWKCAYMIGKNIQLFFSLFFFHDVLNQTVEMSI